MLAEEKETSVIFDETNSPAMVYTWNKAMKKRIKELAEMYPNDVHIESYSLGDSISCTLPKKWVKINPPRKLSSNTRKKFAENARARFGKKKEE